MTYRAVMVSGEPDEEKRSCFDCAWCHGYVSWWCKNESARKRRGTPIPGTTKCPDWVPVEVVRGKRPLKRLLVKLNLYAIPIKGK